MRGICGIDVEYLIFSSIEIHFNCVSFYTNGSFIDWIKVQGISCKIGEKFPAGTRNVECLQNSDSFAISSSSKQIFIHDINVSCGNFILVSSCASLQIGSTQQLFLKDFEIFNLETKDTLQVHSSDKIEIIRKGGEINYSGRCTISFHSKFFTQSRCRMNSREDCIEQEVTTLNITNVTYLNQTLKIESLFMDNLLSISNISFNPSQKIIHIKIIDYSHSQQPKSKNGNKIDFAKLKNIFHFSVSIATLKINWNCYSAEISEIESQNFELKFKKLSLVKQENELICISGNNRLVLNDEWIPIRMKATNFGRFCYFDGDAISFECSKTDFKSFAQIVFYLDIVNVKFLHPMTNSRPLSISDFFNCTFELNLHFYVNSISLESRNFVFSSDNFTLYFSMLENLIWSYTTVNSPSHLLFSGFNEKNSINLFKGTCFLNLNMTELEKSFCQIHLIAPIATFDFPHLICILKKNFQQAKNDIFNFGKLFVKISKISQQLQTSLSFECEKFSCAVDFNLDFRLKFISDNLKLTSSHLTLVEDERIAAEIDKKFMLKNLTNNKLIVNIGELVKQNFDFSFLNEVIHINSNLQKPEISLITSLSSEVKMQENYFLNLVHCSTSQYFPKPSKFLVKKSFGLDEKYFDSNLIELPLRIEFVFEIQGTPFFANSNSFLIKYNSTNKSVTLELVNLQFGFKDEEIFLVFSGSMVINSKLEINLFISTCKFIITKAFLKWLWGMSAGSNSDDQSILPITSLFIESLDLEISFGSNLSNSLKNNSFLKWLCNSFDFSTFQRTRLSIPKFYLNCEAMSKSYLFDEILKHFSKQFNIFMLGKQYQPLQFILKIIRAARNKFESSKRKVTQTHYATDC